MEWEIVYYSRGNESPIYDFIESLDPKAKAKVVNALDLLSEFGIRLGKPKIKKIKGTILWELRILGSDNIRIFYVSVINKKLLLLHGFKKKKQKTDRKEIAIALSRYEESITNK